MQNNNKQFYKYPTCQIETQEVDSSFNIILFGDIDGNFPNIVLEYELKRTFQVINLVLENLRFINSTGIKLFVKYLNQLETPVHIYNAPSVFIDQCNLIIGLISPKRCIKSLYLPYYDEGNDDTVSVLEWVSNIQDKKAPEKKSETGDILTFDRKEELFFKFIDIQNSND